MHAQLVCFILALWIHDLWTAVPVLLCYVSFFHFEVLFVFVALIDVLILGGSVAFSLFSSPAFTSRYFTHDMFEQRGVAAAFCV